MDMECNGDSMLEVEISELLDEGKVEEAIKLCEKNISYGKIGECLRSIGWFFYGKNDSANALHWFNRAVDMNDVESSYGIACTYFNEQNYDLALEAYKKSSEKGYPRAYYWVGYMYEQGLGKPKDSDIAKGYYTKGKEQGYLMAERALIHLKLKESSYLEKVFIFVSYISLLTKAFFIAKKNISDERLADVPNVFNK